MLGEPSGEPHTWASATKSLRAEGLGEPAGLACVARSLQMQSKNLFKQDWLVRSRNPRNPPAALELGGL